MRSKQIGTPLPTTTHLTSCVMLLRFTSPSLTQSPSETRGGRKLLLLPAVLKIGLLLVPDYAKQLKGKLSSLFYYSFEVSCSVCGWPRPAGWCPSGDGKPALHLGSRDYKSMDLPALMVAGRVFDYYQIRKVYREGFIFRLWYLGKLLFLFISFSNTHPWPSKWSRPRSCPSSTS